MLLLLLLKLMINVHLVSRVSLRSGRYNVNIFIVALQLVLKLLVLILLLELSVWASHHRVEDEAVEQLGMTAPALDQVRLVSQ